MILDEIIERYTSNAEYERTHGNLQGCLEFRQLVEWLKELKENKDMLNNLAAEIEQNAYPIVHGVNNHEKGMTLYGIMQIIDKYRAESEDKE